MTDAPANITEATHKIFQLAQETGQQPEWQPANGGTVRISLTAQSDGEGGHGFISVEAATGEVTGGIMTDPRFDILCNSADQVREALRDMQG